MKNAASGKTVVKPSARKKPVGSTPARKPAASRAARKPGVNKTATKKVVKKAPGKAAKKIPKKTATKVARKTAVKKGAAKKAAPRSIANKAVVKKPVGKPAAKKVTKKPVAKKSEQKAAARTAAAPKKAVRVTQALRPVPKSAPSPVPRAVVSPPGKTIRRADEVFSYSALSPAEALNHFRDVLRAKQERVRRGPGYPAPNAYTGRHDVAGTGPAPTSPPASVRSGNDAPDEPALSASNRMHGRGNQGMRGKK